MQELDAAIFRLCEALGFKLDMGAPSHIEALQEFKRKLAGVEVKKQDNRLQSLVDKCHVMRNAIAEPAAKPSTREHRVLGKLDEFVTIRTAESTLAPRNGR